MFKNASKLPRHTICVQIKTPTPVFLDPKPLNLTIGTLFSLESKLVSQEIIVRYREPGPGEILKMLVCVLCVCMCAHWGPGFRGQGSGAGWTKAVGFNNPGEHGLLWGLRIPSYVAERKEKVGQPHHDTPERLSWEDTQQRLSGGENQRGKELKFERRCQLPLATW